MTSFLLLATNRFLPSTRRGPALADAFLAREDGTVVEGFVDPQLRETDLGQQRGAVRGEHEFLIVAVAAVDEQSRRSDR